MSGDVAGRHSVVRHIRTDSRILSNSTTVATTNVSNDYNSEHCLV
jgi:hypothetical protein